MKRVCIVIPFIAFVLALAACGGGGSTSGSGFNPPGPPPTQAPPTSTNATAIVVSDPAGKPLAHVKVQLDPWIAFPTPGPTPTPILTTRTDASGRFKLHAKNGDYLLVIGPDAVNTPPPGWSTPEPNATDTPIPGAHGWLATVHDHITLTGGNQTLTAPTMPPQPMYTPPAVETSGKYRLATLDPLLEAPCILAYNQDRVALDLTAAVVDEWLTENARAIVKSVIAWNSKNPGGGDIVTFLTGDYGHSSVNGGTNCTDNIGPAKGPNFIALSQAVNPNDDWFGGAYATYENNTQAEGDAAFPIDPRVYDQTNGPSWP